MDIEKIIFDLEQKLQQSDVRKSAGELDKLISDDFLEFGSSGSVFGKQDVLKNLPASSEVVFTMTDFNIRVLSGDIVQSIFRTEKKDVQTGAVSRSLRSSLWRKEEGIWRMIFHQGTPSSL